MSDQTTAAGPSGEGAGEETMNGSGMVALGAEECSEVLASERLCVLAMADGGEPYAIPLFYGYDGRSLWLGISEGRKTSILERNDRLCVVVTQHADDAWRSVLVRGRARWITDPEERKRGIQVLMDHNRKFRRAQPTSSPQRRHSGGRVLLIADAVVTGRAKR